MPHTMRSLLGVGLALWAVPALAAAQPPPSSPLAGTQWNLVEFQSMDDAQGTTRPSKGSLYTMWLHGDGTATMQLNCNRATGTWSATPGSDPTSGRFEFGPLAATSALCPPPSLDESIVAQSRFVRSFVLKDGRLYLSLMADGGIYVWAPAGGAAASDPRPAALALPRVEPVSPCFAAPSATTKIDYRYDCGYVVVPEDRKRPGGRTVKLGFLRLRSRTETSEPPLFMLAGGPGGSLIVPSLFDLFQPGLLSPVLDRRDVVVLDQRGTRHTVPHLDCPEFHTLPWTVYRQQLSAEAAAGLELRQLERCVDGFRQQGIDLSQYNSLALAADVADARRALGYGKIVYYGASYGSQLGQHVMRDFPSILQAVILDGTSALSRRSWVEDRAIDLEFSLRQLDTLCRDDEKCRAAFDVPALLEKGLALFSQGPIPASFVDPAQPGSSFSIEVTQNDFAGLVYEKLGYRIGVSSLPFILQQLTKDGKASMGQVLGQWRGEKLLASRNASGGELATGMYMAVVCSDDPVRSPGEVIRKGAGPLPLLFAGAAARELIRMCQAVKVPSLPNRTDINVTSAIPTLILSGRLDAQTPTFRSEEVKKTLSNAQLAVFPDGTHVQVGAVNRCAMKMIAHFLDNPRAAVPTDCLRDHSLPGFALPEETISKPEKSGTPTPP